MLEGFYVRGVGYFVDLASDVECGLVLRRVAMADEPVDRKQKRVGVVFIGGDLDGKQAVLNPDLLWCFRHAVLPTSVCPQDWSGDNLSIPVSRNDRIEEYHGCQFHVQRPYFLMLLDGIGVEEAWLRILDYYVEHADAINVKQASY
jgi:hypothetical protein